MTGAAVSEYADGDRCEETPAQRRKRRVRDTIIAAAEEVFAEEGEAGLSMRRLAERIDYSPAAIYKYFRSKGDLIQSIREAFFERLLDRLENVAAEAPAGETCFRECLRAYIETGLEQPNHYRMVSSGWSDENTNAIPEEGTKQFEAALTLEAMIEHNVADGVFRPMDPKIAAKSVWAALHGLTLLMVEIEEFPYGLAGSEHVTREAVIDFHVDLVFRGLEAD